MGLNQIKSVAEMSSKVWGNCLEICWGTVSKTGVLSGNGFISGRIPRQAGISMDTSLLVFDSLRGSK